LLNDCLTALRAQDTPLDELIVVDDSPNSSLASIDGACVLRSGGRGPYAARNVGWRSTDADIVLFLDVRCRPWPDWTHRMTDVFRDTEVAVAGSEVRIRGGASLAACASERHQFFELHKYLENGFFRPYFPTCNLAVRRDDLLAVDGFDEVRSGGDADLCWRILARPARRHEAVREVLMEWVPRDRVRDYLEQNYRYGKSNRALRLRWQREGAPLPEPWPGAVLARRLVKTGVLATLARVRRCDEELVGRLLDGARLAFQVGYRVAAKAERRAAARGGGA